jgi:hypothetical protein
VEGLSEISFSQHVRALTLGYRATSIACPRSLHTQRFFCAYSPDNCTIIAVGDVDHAALMALVRALRELARAARSAAHPSSPSGAGRTARIEGPRRPHTSRARLSIPPFIAGQARAPEDACCATAALQVVHGLAFSEPSPLYQRLVERRTVLGSRLGRHFAIRTFVVTATLPKVRLRSALSAIQEISRASVAAGRAEHRGGEVAHPLLDALQPPQAPADVAGADARMIAAGGRLEVLHRYLAAVAAVTPDDVARAAREHLIESRRFVVTLSTAGGPS